MPILLNVEECNGYTRFLPVAELDPENRRQAGKIHAEYRLRRIVMGGSFDNNEWMLTDETKRVRLCFAIDKSKFEHTGQAWIGCTAGCYEECMKAYAAFQFGRFSLTTIRLIIEEFKKLALTTVEDACSQWKEGNHVISFLSLIPDSNASRDAVIEWLEEQGTVFRKEKNPRRLSGFRTYLCFHKVIGDYWQQADEADKVFYFPVWLWWNLTAILPLRATEFLLLPQDCLQNKHGKYILTIRRTRLKKRESKISYTVEKDYEQKAYDVPEWMAVEITQYQKATAGVKRNGLKTLFVAEKESTYGFFTYAQANQLLHRFCKEIAGDPLFPIRLGDTRHLAMINLILSGGSPVICRELAGHESIGISSHYYANLSSVVESVVYDRYHGSHGTTALEGSLRFRLGRPSDGTRLADGWCDVPEVTDGDIGECMKVYSTARHIGDCRSCPHFFPDEPGIKLMVEKERKTAVDADVAFLVQMIEQVRKGNGYTEEIQAALLRLQNSAFYYGSALARRLEQEEK